MALYAAKDMDPGSELLFDYDGDNSLSKIFEWIKPKSETVHHRKVNKDYKNDDLKNYINF